ncbi:esterase [Candidatus Pelagibacter sp.]|nr:esterase [Candidatus Pelagibacter sp.]
MNKNKIFMQKYKLSWKDLSFKDFKVYLFALFKAFIPKKKIKNLDDLEFFIQTKSAWVTQVTLYSYLKTRMGTRYVLHFDNDVFMSSLNIAKWNIYSVALQDLTFFTFSYLKVNFNYQDFNQAKEIFNKILDDETSNNMPLAVIEDAKKTFDERLENLDWETYYKDLPFNLSALSLYKWAPIAEELKTLDRKIVLNSMILKWDIIRNEFEKLIEF